MPLRSRFLNVPSGGSPYWTQTGIFADDFFDQATVAVGSASVGAVASVDAQGSKVTSEQHTGTASVAAAASIAASGKKIAVGSASVAAGASVSAAGKKVAQGATVILTAAGVAAGGTKRGIGAADVQAQAPISATGTKQASGSASISVVVSVEARTEQPVTPEEPQPAGRGGRTSHYRLERKAKHRREDEVIMRVIHKFLEVVQ